MAVAMVAVLENHWVAQTAPWKANLLVEHLAALKADAMAVRKAGLKDWCLAVQTAVSLENELAARKAVWKESLRAGHWAASKVVRWVEQTVEPSEHCLTFLSVIQRAGTWAVWLD